jgi:hypothetical protein
VPKCPNTPTHAADDEGAPDKRKGKQPTLMSSLVQIQVPMEATLFDEQPQSTPTVTALEPMPMPDQLPVPPLLQEETISLPPSPTRGHADTSMSNQTQLLQLLDGIIGNPADAGPHGANAGQATGQSTQENENLALPLIPDNAPPGVQDDPPLDQSAALQEVITAAITKGSHLDIGRGPTRDPLDKYTKAPMPSIQDAHPASLYNRIDHTTIGKWITLPKSKLLAIPFDIETNNLKMHENIRNRILAAVAEITVSKCVGVVAPTPSEEALSSRRYPSTFLIYNLSEMHQRILLKREVWSSANITFRISPLELSNPDFMFAITSLAILEAEGIKAIVKEVWGDDATRAYIEASAIKTTDSIEEQNNIKQMFKDFFDSMWISNLEIRTRGNALEPHFNIYAKGSLIRGTNTWSDLRRYLANRAYTDPTQGQGTVSQSPFHCTACHAVDHPRGLCPFPAIEGWNGPKWKLGQNQPLKGGRTRNYIPRGA